jgi:hypothetical protein
MKAAPAKISIRESKDEFLTPRDVGEVRAKPGHPPGPSLEMY